MRYRIFALRILILLLPLPLVQACQRRSPPVSDRGREVCLYEAAAESGTASQAGKRFTECIKSIDQRLAREQTSQQQQQRAIEEAEDTDKPREVSAERRYFFCLANREAIRASNDRLSSAMGRWKALSSSRPAADPAVVEAKATYEEAYAEFEKAIPPEMRGGMSLIPDAARVFRNCHREDFVD